MNTPQAPHHHNRKARLLMAKLDTTTNLKTCYRCKQSLDISYFHSDVSRVDGLNPKCKLCTLETSKDYYMRHAAQVVKRSIEWARKNKAKKNASTRRWRAANPEAARQAVARWVQENPEKDKASRRNWLRNHPEWVAARQAIARARRKGAQQTEHPLTATEWLYIKAAYNHRCVYCDRKLQRLTQDHIIPVSKGGRHTIENVVPACASCNSRKGVKEPLVPVQPMLALHFA